MKLTVAVPTFNRNDILRINLELLMPQFTADCELLIIDNCSDLPVAITLQDLLDEYPNVKRRIVRNQVNIGASANLLRCFELCETEWIWCLGDDDSVVTNAVNVVLETIAEYPNALFLNFLTPQLKRPVRRRSRGLKEFIGVLDHYGNILFISASVFRLKPLLPNIRYGYQYAYSCAPQLAILLSSLSEEGECVLLEKTLISKLRLVGISKCWSLIDVALPMFTLQRLAGLGPGRQALAKHIASLVVFEGVVFQLINLRLRGMSKMEALYLYDDYAKHYWQATRQILTLIKSSVYRMCIACPKMGDWIFRLAISIKKRKVEDYATSDRE